jgi:hypothetical protein
MVSVSFAQNPGRRGLVETPLRKTDSLREQKYIFAMVTLTGSMIVSGWSLLFFGTAIVALTGGMVGGCWSLLASQRRVSPGQDQPLGSLRDVVCEMPEVGIARALDVEGATAGVLDRIVVVQHDADHDLGVLEQKQKGVDAIDGSCSVTL